MSLFDGMINKALPKLLTSAINSKLDNIGDINDLNINLQDKKMWGKLNLRGENEPLNFDIKFDISNEDEKYFLIIKDIFTTKIWLNNAFRTYAKDTKFPIPDEYKKYLKMVI